MPSAEPLMDRPAETLREAQRKTHCHPLQDVKIQVNSNTLVEVDASKVVGTWAERIARMEIRTVNETLSQLEAETLINTPCDALA